VLAVYFVSVYLMNQNAVATVNVRCRVIRNSGYVLEIRKTNFANQGLRSSTFSENIFKVEDVFPLLVLQFRFVCLMVC